MIDVHEYGYAIFLRHEGHTINLSFTMKTRQAVFRRFSNFNIFALYDEKAIYWHTICERGKKLLGLAQGIVREVANDILMIFDVLNSTFLRAICFNCEEGGKECMVTACFKII